ncbi:MAG: hypothetical protein VB083_10125 [Aminobacterium sp.]|nr:hypothetical protein [Aminobacterium sp.]MEA4878257.1 hypothetical protein [Aminobacterium sp.]
MTPVWIALYDPDPKALSITYNVVGSVEGIEIVGCRWARVSFRLLR